MEAVIFIGIQASGKSTFYIEKFFNTHMRISMDLLNTRNKEKKFIEACFHIHQPFVVDNTNPSKKDRLRYIEPAKANKYKVIGYYFKAKLGDALENEKRSKEEKIPKMGIIGTYRKLEIPTIAMLPVECWN